jgi:hypothetical protein
MADLNILPNPAPRPPSGPSTNAEWVALMSDIAISKFDASLILNGGRWECVVSVYGEDRYFYGDKLVHIREQLTDEGVIGVTPIDAA